MSKPLRSAAHGGSILVLSDERKLPFVMAAVYGAGIDPARVDVLLSGRGGPPSPPSGLARPATFVATRDDAARYFSDAHGRYDLLLSFGFAYRVPAELLESAPWGGINVHFGRLPHHRGFFPIPWAILNCESEAVLTVHRMDEGIDTGPILRERGVAIDALDTAHSLYFRMLALAPAEIGPVLCDPAADGRLQQGAATYHDRCLPLDGVIDPAWPADRVERFIRAMYFPPHPPAALRRGGEEIPIWTYQQYQQLQGSQR